MNAIIAIAALLAIAAAQVPRPIYIGVPVLPKLTPLFKWEEIKANQRLPAEDIDFSAVPDGIESQPKSSGLVLPPPEGHIVNGNVAYPGQFPWQAAIDLEGKSFCGGSLIAPKVVLTAGHCVLNYTTFTVTLGAHLLKKTESTRVVQVTKTGIVHKEYNRTEAVNDIAVLLFENTFPLTDRINTIALPTKSMVSEDFVGYFTTVSGWGQWNLLPWVSIALNYVNLPILPDFLCTMYFGRYIRPTTICGEGGSGRGSCKGDSGGPATVNLNGTEVIIGIVSFGSYLGCDRGYPSVFTRVTSYLGWIQENTGIIIEE